MNRIVSRGPIIDSRNRLRLIRFVCLCPVLILIDPLHERNGISLSVKDNIPFAVSLIQRLIHGFGRSFYITPKRNNLVYFPFFFY